MALHAYSISDGTTTFNLSSGATCVTTGYVVGSPETDAQDRPSFSDGGEVDGPRYHDVTESLELMIIGASDSVLRDNFHTLERLLDGAKRRQQRKTEPRVYFQVQIDTDASAWRSEILRARLEISKDGLAVWGNYKVPCVLHLTRRYFFEGPRTELSISSNGNSAATGGRSITNNSNNWIQIANTQIGGVLPTPVELQLTNNTGGSVAYRNFYMATNAFSSPANLTQELGSGSYTLAGSGTSYSGEITYSLSSTQMGYTQGRPFKFLARFTVQSGNIYVKPVLRDSTNLSTLVEGDEVYRPAASFGSQFIDLGSLPLPPGGWQSSWGGTTLTFMLRGVAAYNVTIASVKLMALDSFQYIAQRGFSISNGGTITFDNIERLYHTGGQSIYSVRNGVLMVYPNVTQRINIIEDEGTSSDTSKTLSVRAYVRERRLTV